MIDIKIAEVSAIFFAKKTEIQVLYFKVKRGYKNVRLKIIIFSTSF